MIPELVLWPVAKAVAAAAESVMTELAVWVFTDPEVSRSRFSGAALCQRARVWMLAEQPSGTMTMTFLTGRLFWPGTVAQEQITVIAATAAKRTK